MTQITDLQLNIIVIGESGVGKSSLCKKFSGENKTVSGPTIVACSWQKSIVVNDVKVKLLICDAAGQETFRDNLTSYFHKKDGVLAVYDVTKEETFQKLSSWLKLVKKYNDDFVALIVGNKTDYSNEKSIKHSDVKNFGKENGLAFMETSAKNGNNVEKVFEYLVLKLLLKKKVLSVDKLTFVSSTLLLHESPILSSSCSISTQNWVEDISENTANYVYEEDPTQVQNVSKIKNSEKTLPSAELPCPILSSKDGTKPTSPSQITEGTNRNEVAYANGSPSQITEGTNRKEVACANGSAFADSSATFYECNELPPIVPLTTDEIVELYVQRQRRMSSNSISSLAMWDSSLVLEYEEAIRQYEEARAEAAKKKPGPNCILQ